MTATPKDLQGEVERLKAALEEAKEALMDGSGAGVFWRESAVARINKALQTPPESAAEKCEHKMGVYMPGGGTKCADCPQVFPNSATEFCKGCPDCKGVVWNGVGD